LLVAGLYIFSAFQALLIAVRHALCALLYDIWWWPHGL